MKPAVIIFIITTLLGLGGAGFLFTTNRTLISEKIVLEQNLAGLKDEKGKVDTELAVLKNSDWAKEIELLRLKLKTAEKDLASAEINIDTLGRDLSREQQRAKTAEANLGKIKPYLDVVDDVQDTYFKYIATETALNRIEAKIKALGDQEMFELWTETRRQTTPNSSNPSATSAVIARAIFLIRNLLR